MLKAPSWEDYLAAGVDELVPYLAASPQPRRRLAEMVDTLLAEAPPIRRAFLEARQQAIAAL